MNFRFLQMADKSPRRMRRAANLDYYVTPRDEWEGVHRRHLTPVAVVMVHEPTLNVPELFGSEVTHDLNKLKTKCDVIVANRWSDDLADVADKVCSRDLFRRD